jgi:subtilisin family serine protease
VTVAVIDSGIDTDHPDLNNDLIWEECFLDDSGCPVTGGKRASDSGSAEDGFGHGTHVSGIITSGNATYRVLLLIPKL